MLEKLKRSFVARTLAHFGRHKFSRTKEATNFEGLSAFLPSRSISQIPECEMKPIFILSSSWRSASTLLARLVLSTDSCLIWGEPYCEMGPIQRLYDGLTYVSSGRIRDEWYASNFSKLGSSLAFQNEACLFPDLGDLLVAHREFLMSLFHQPAKRAGFRNWGLKEVRLDVNHAKYLQLLFPEAKFIFLVRNPFHAYSSYAGSLWYDRWPNRPIYTPWHFGKHWKRLTSGFISADLPNSILVKYDDLIPDSDGLQRLEDFLGASVDRSVLSNKLGSSTSDVSWIEQQLLGAAVSPISTRLGYQA
jgi:hypothetical protein